MPSAVLLKEPSQTAEVAPMAILVEIPDGLKDFADAIRSVVACVSEQCKSAFGGRAVRYGAFEDTLAEACAHIECAGHAATLGALDVDAPAVLIDGVRHVRGGHAPATYYCMAGPVEVTRTLYRAPGGGTVDAISVRAGVIEGGWLPRTADAMAFEVQKATSREAERSGAKIKRLPYSHTAFERVAHKVGAHYVERHQDIEEELIDVFRVPEKATSVAASLDRVTVPIEEPRPRPPGRPRKNAPKHPIKVVYRMAYCATLTLCDAKGEALHTIRYGRMPSEDAQELCEGMAADTQALLRQRRDLRIQLVCDGAPEMWNLLEAAFTEVVLGQKPHENVDFHHVTEKLGEAAKITHPDAVSATVERWRLRLLNISSAASEILTELIASGREDVPLGDTKPVHDAITYFTNHAHRLNYAEARRLGLAIASGAVEASCKSLFNIRFKRSGARWKTETGAHIVHLRALGLSDRWDHAIALTLEPLRKPIRLVA